MLLTVGNTKGGVGKTTLALNLAVARARAGRNVWLVDGDRQATAATAARVRADAGQQPVLVCNSYPDGETLQREVSRQGIRYDDIVIDAGGRDSSGFRAALTLSDTLLVPVQPRSYDVWALHDLTALLDEAARVRTRELRVLAVLNGADPGERSKDNAEAAEAVAESGRFELLPGWIRRRKIFASAAGNGLSVLETKPRDPLATTELRALVASIYGDPS